ncbi:MAG: hypothetical protein ACKO7Q_11685, partial [Actinomycetota bacterium]
MPPADDAAEPAASETPPDPAGDVARAAEARSAVQAPPAAPAGGRKMTVHRAGDGEPAAPA